jgi:dolichol-phosphate mannosyltransferase
MNINDATSGYRCWRHKTLAAIDFDSIASDGYAFQIEMLFQAYRLGFRLQETNIIFIDRTSGTSKISRKMVCEAMWIPWKLQLRRLFHGFSRNESRGFINPAKAKIRTDFTTYK